MPLKVMGCRLRINSSKGSSVMSTLSMNSRMISLRVAESLAEAALLNTSWTSLLYFLARTLSFLSTYLETLKKVSRAIFWSTKLYLSIIFAADCSNSTVLRLKKSKLIASASRSDVAAVQLILKTGI